MKTEQWINPLTFFFDSIKSGLICERCVLSPGHLTVVQHLQRDISLSYRSNCRSLMSLSTHCMSSLYHCVCCWYAQSFSTHSPEKTSLSKENTPCCQRQPGSLNAICNTGRYQRGAKQEIWDLTLTNYFAEAKKQKLYLPYCNMRGQYTQEQLTSDVLYVCTQCSSKKLQWAQQDGDQKK